MNKHTLKVAMIIHAKHHSGKLDHLWLRVECTLFAIYKAGREPTPYW